MDVIGIGSDEAAFGLKQTLIEFLEERGYRVEDYGCYSEDPVDYPEAAEAVAREEHGRAILCCGTGIGVCITTNKVPGVRAAQCHDVYSAERARKSNDAQILTMGARVVGPELAKSIVSAWLESEFQGGRPARKVEKIEEVNRRYHAVANKQG